MTRLEPGWASALGSGLAPACLAHLSSCATAHAEIKNCIVGNVGGGQKISEEQHDALCQASLHKDAPCVSIFSRTTHRSHEHVYLLWRRCHIQTCHAITVGALMGRRFQCDVFFWLQVVESLTEMVLALRAERKRSMEVSLKRHIALLWLTCGAKKLHIGSHSGFLLRQHIQC